MAEQENYMLRLPGTLAALCVQHVLAEASRGQECGSSSTLSRLPVPKVLVLRVAARQAPQHAASSQVQR